MAPIRRVQHSFPIGKAEKSSSAKANSKTYKKQEGITQVEQFTMGTTFLITNVSGNVHVIQELDDVGAFLRSLDTTEDAACVKIDQLTYHIQRISKDSKFMVYPCVVLCENGERINTVPQGSSRYVDNAIDSNINGMYSIGILDPIIGKYDVQSGKYYGVPRSYDISSMANIFLQDWYKKTLDEESPAYLDFQIVLVQFGLDDGNYLTVEGFVDVKTHNERMF